MADDLHRRPRKGERAARAVVHYNGVRYWRDLAKCRNELTRLQAAGEAITIGSLAQEVGVSRSTAERFLSGWDVSMSSTLKILGRLGLCFADVHAMVEGDGGEPG